MSQEYETFPSVSSTNETSNSSGGSICPEKLLSDLTEKLTNIETPWERHIDFVNACIAVAKVDRELKHHSLRWKSVKHRLPYSLLVQNDKHRSIAKAIGNMLTEYGSALDPISEFVGRGSWEFLSRRRNRKVADRIIIELISLRSVIGPSPKIYAYVTRRARELELDSALPKKKQ